VARESLLVAGLVLLRLLLLLLLLLVGELVLLRLLLLLLVRTAFEDGLAVLLLVLQLGGYLALGRNVPSVLAISSILGRIGSRLLVRGRNRPDGGVLVFL
jgi:hypothetical protein